jgi:hypothetical protein
MKIYGIYWLYVGDEHAAMAKNTLKANYWEKHFTVTIGVALSGVLDSKYTVNCVSTSWWVEAANGTGHEGVWDLSIAVGHFVEMCEVQWRIYSKSFDIKRSKSCCTCWARGTSGSLEVLRPFLAMLHVLSPILAGTILYPIAFLANFVGCFQFLVYSMVIL